jgi:hypothetical protein
MNLNPMVTAATSGVAGFLFNELEPNSDCGRTRAEGEKLISLWRRDSLWDWDVGERILSILIS